MAIPSDTAPPAAADIVMRRADLTGLPRPHAPPPYAVRSFRAGDEAAWADLCAAAFPDVPDPRGIPAREFLGRPAWRPERMFFVCLGDVPVASAAAWENPDRWGPRTGQVHWVATDPAHRGRGLARAAVSAALRWMRGPYDRAVLVTQVHRLPAIRLYLSLGFLPDLDAFPEMAARWAAVTAALRETA